MSLSIFGSHLGVGADSAPLFSLVWRRVSLFFNFFLFSFFFKSRGWEKKRQSCSLGCSYKFPDSSPHPVFHHMHKDTIPESTAEIPEHSLSKFSFSLEHDLFQSTYFGSWSSLLCLFFFFCFLFCWSRQDIFSHALFDSLLILVELVSARCWDISGKLMRVVSTTPTPAVAWYPQVVALCRGFWVLGRSDVRTRENMNYGSQAAVTHLNLAESESRITRWALESQWQSWVPSSPFQRCFARTVFYRVKFCRVTGGQTHNLLNRHVTLLKLGNSMSQICTRAKRHKAFQLKVQCVKFFAFSSLSVGVP